MDDKKLIAKIRELRQIKPSQNWVVLNKKMIMGDSEEASFIGDVRQVFGFIFKYKPAFASLITLGLIIGTVVLSQNSLPGDTLYSVRRATERGQALLLSKDGQAKLVFDVANRRLDDLTRVAQANSVKNLAPAISEYQASASEVAKSLSQETTRNGKLTKETIQEVKKMEEKKERIESLGVQISDNKALDSAIGQLVESEIKDLESRTLTDEQMKTIDEIKTSYKDGRYSEALEKILFLNAQ